MAAYHPTTFMALPFFRFLFQELPDAMLFYVFEVFYHFQLPPMSLMYCNLISIYAAKLYTLSLLTFSPI